MTVRTIVVVAFLALGVPLPVGAQVKGQPPTADDEASLAQCAQVQPVVQKLIDAASMRLEQARQVNSASALRAAVDDVEGALRDLRVQLEPCAKTQVIDPHTGHAMPTAPAAAKPSPAKQPTAPDPHAGHAMPAAAKPASTAKPAQAKPPAKPPATDSHADHDMSAAKPEAARPAATTEVTDPVCGLKVDPSSAPSAQHAGQTFYFCSERHRESFQKSPAKYLPKKE